MAQIAQQDNLVIEVTTTAAALDGDTILLTQTAEQ